ncbi:hypothetical protein HBI56_105910 [Parastagonospora nodorum]|nr:hypothetical protein HBH56_132980 [Parastagonospora nodorum]KAH3927018.1 hypothetical protein HBH54_160250 [Parastagonospora nodorum]KAH3949231.1 hypothetical protein HBH53_087940 [Parastagonospora nodorum]KAH3974790.1 hypothetical protein HBH52_133560 [Parastagonospora nodorum]KAH3977614.1 hypothetical protein HBH51_067940 [Parastagonospora nodorum]
MHALAMKELPGGPHLPFSCRAIAHSRDVQYGLTVSQRSSRQVSTTALPCGTSMADTYASIEQHLRITLKY